ncbi:MAG TPA: hypothetical protein VNL71_10585 [Chloroflexota bacterium]|nr:hypothetical protein [Chloroflexota bacterium]
MRISERKRQLREQGASGQRESDSTDEQPVRPERAAQRSAVAARTPVRQRSTSSRQGKARTPVARKPRGPRFYAGFGFVGLLFSILLIQNTYSTYNSDHKAFPAKLSAYVRQSTAYPAAVATYHAALAKHVKPTPKAPVKPVAPVDPTLSIGSFALPLLYVVLSLAYLYLAYRASRQQKAPATPIRAAPARG